MSPFDNMCLYVLAQCGIKVHRQNNKHPTILCKIHELLYVLGVLACKYTNMMVAQGIQF